MRNGWFTVALENRSFTPFEKSCWRDRLTCEAGQRKLSGALVCSFVKIGKHSKGKLSFVERMATNDAQVLQWNPGCCVERDQHIAAHFFNRLDKEKVKQSFVVEIKTQSQGNKMK